MTLKDLGLDFNSANKILDNAPASSEQMYWMPFLKIYYIKGKRKNAMIYCPSLDNWRTSARYNDEIVEAPFIPLAEIKKALE